MITPIQWDPDYRSLEPEDAGQGLGGNTGLSEKLLTAGRRDLLAAQTGTCSVHPPKQRLLLAA